MTDQETTIRAGIHEVRPRASQSYQPYQSYQSHLSYPSYAEVR